MRIGVFGDTHDHVDNVRRAVYHFNAEKCEAVLFVGDFVSPLVVPSLRKLKCPMLACFGDSDGNKTGIAGGMRIVGQVGEPPFCYQAPDGTRILITHIPEMVRGVDDDCQVVVSSHTHKPSIRKDEEGRLYLNPGETGGWVYRRPTIAILETNPLEARIIKLPEMPQLADEELNATAH